jgi:hypothetical protein
MLATKPLRAGFAAFTRRRSRRRPTGVTDCSRSSVCARFFVRLVHASDFEDCALSLVIDSTVIIVLCRTVDLAYRRADRDPKPPTEFFIAQCPPKIRSPVNPSCTGRFLEMKRTVILIPAWFDSPARQLLDVGRVPRITLQNQPLPGFHQGFG